MGPDGSGLAGECLVCRACHVAALLGKCSTMLPYLAAGRKGEQQRQHGGGSECDRDRDRDGGGDGGRERERNRGDGCSGGRGEQHRGGHKRKREGFSDSKAVDSLRMALTIGGRLFSPGAVPWLRWPPCNAAACPCSTCPCRAACTGVSTYDAASRTMEAGGSCFMACCCALLCRRLCQPPGAPHGAAQRLPHGGGGEERPGAAASLLRAGEQRAVPAAVLPAAATVASRHAGLASRPFYLERALRPVVDHMSALLGAGAVRRCRWMLTLRACCQSGWCIMSLWPPGGSSSARQVQP